ncbi:UNVERIFIED_CONTAM: hypothetical protein GTU68_044027, partial [Idotea baltica]|nr:hypothetical protein [Idotea baltica]
DCALGYRDSFFKRVGKGQFLVTRVVLCLQKNPTFNTQYGAIGEELAKMGESISLRSVSQAIINIRQSKLPDPKVVGNAGSFFKNPVVAITLFEKILSQYPDMPHYDQPDGRKKIPAAWLIQTCGWKGKRFGEHGVHPNQALVLVNYGEAKGQDIFDLSQRIRESVQTTFGIDLEREVNVM